MAERGSRWSARGRDAGRLVAVAAALGVAGCGTVSDAGSYALVLQDRYAYSTCEELRSARSQMTNRAKDLAELIDKANTGGIAGAVVGATTYRSELEFTRAHLKFIVKTEQEKRCPPPRL